MYLDFKTVDQVESQHSRGYNPYSVPDGGLAYDYRIKPKVKLQRTSTPVSEFEELSVPTNSSDSVNEFFYQSWKRELRPDKPEEVDESTRYSLREQLNHEAFPQDRAQVRALWYMVEPIVYINQIFVPYVNFQMVGWRPDGTYGVLNGFYWM